MPGCRARPFGISSPWIACGRCGQAPTEHCARCCPTGTQDLARHETRFQQALDAKIQEALGQGLTSFADLSIFGAQELDQWLLDHKIQADAMEIMACEQRWRHLNRFQGHPDDTSGLSEEGVAISRQQQPAATSSRQRQQAAASSCHQRPRQPAASVGMQDEWAYADVVTGRVYGKCDVRPVGMQLRLVSTRRAIRLSDKPAPSPIRAPPPRQPQAVTPPGRNLKCPGACEIHASAHCAGDCERALGGHPAHVCGPCEYLLGCDVNLQSNVPPGSDALWSRSSLGVEAA